MALPVSLPTESALLANALQVDPPYVSPLSALAYLNWKLARQTSLRLHCCQRLARRSECGQYRQNARWVYRLFDHAISRKVICWRREHGADPVETPIRCEVVIAGGSAASLAAALTAAAAAPQATVCLTDPTGETFVSQCRSGPRWLEFFQPTILTACLGCIARQTGRAASSPPRLSRRSTGQYW